jgi:PAS domain S-box-containing protein
VHSSPENGFGDVKIWIPGSKTIFWRTIMIIAIVFCVFILALWGVILNRAKTKRLEDENRIILNSVPAMIWFKDRNNRILRCNSLAARNRGLKIEEMEGHLTTDFFPDEAGEYFADDLEVINSGKAKLGIVELLAVDSQKIWVRTDKVPYRNLKGEVIGVIVFAVDISHEKQAEQKIAELADDLKRAVTLRDEFMSIASHELKTPLTSLSLQLEYLREFQVSQEKLVMLVSKSKTLVDRLAKLVNEMLDLSRISEGHLSLQREEVDLCQLTYETLQQCAEQLQIAGCSVDVYAPQSVIGCWDRFRIEQVLVNLLTNAMKYGKGKPITISVTKEGAGARLVVKDRGAGISPDDRERIFERFERVAPKGMSGLGLGLYIVRQILLKHAGTICVESEVGFGSSFIVELPLQSG